MGQRLNNILDYYRAILCGYFLTVIYCHADLERYRYRAQLKEII